MGFHVDGFARDLLNLPARLVIPVPAGVSHRDAACAPIAFATVQHMLFDNASSSRAKAFSFTPAAPASAPPQS
jgi:NADPH:quinone reductase-like Zn-dependent oxidoreductase